MYLQAFDKNLHVGFCDAKRDAEHGRKHDQEHQRVKTNPENREDCCPKPLHRVTLPHWTYTGKHMGN